MAPMVLANISKLPSQHQDIVLRIVIKVDYSIDTFGFVAIYCCSYLYLFKCFLLSINVSYFYIFVLIR